MNHDNKKVLLLDLDGTVLNTAGLIHEAILLLAQLLSLSSSDLLVHWYEEYRAQTKGETFDPYQLAQFWSARMQGTVANDLYRQFLLSAKVAVKSHIYPEVEVTLGMLRATWAVALFSQGQTAWQLLKAAEILQLASIPDELQFVHADKTSTEYLRSVANQLQALGFQQIAYVDDRMDALRRFWEHWPTDISPIPQRYWINRQGVTPQLEDGQTDVLEIASLAELLEKSNA